MAMRRLITLKSVVSLLLIGTHAAQITTQTRQSINGIGASGAWWSRDISLFPTSVQQNISELLLNQQTGLGLTDFRYNLGGGGVGVGTWARAPETPYISDGNYDFSKDAAGTFYLKEAARLGVPQITLFVNSAPTTMTSNAKNCGGQLTTSRIPAYAKYIADVVSHWKSQGVTITHVSPMNEPDSTFGASGGGLCGQEGMQVLPSQRAQLVTAVASALSSAGLSTKVIADESSETSNYAADEPQWLTPTVGKSLAGNAHHQYGFASAATQQSTFEQGRNLSGGVPTWFTEICCYVPTSTGSTDPLAALTYGGNYDPTMLSGLRMANLIYQSFTYAEDEHWDWWTALSSGIGACEPSNSNCWNSIRTDGWDDGLIYYDFNYQNSKFYTLLLTKRYSILRHFTKAAPVGAVRRTVSGSGADGNWRIVAFDAGAGCAAFGTCSQSVHSIVAFNGQSGSASLTLTGLTKAPSSMVRTSPTEDYVSVQVPSFNGGSRRV